MKQTLFRTIVPIANYFFRLFFDRKYLDGRFFVSSLGGYKWAAQAVWVRNVLRLGKPYPWPVHLSCYISNPENISFDPDDLNNFQARGTYYQCFEGHIHIGKGCYIGPNVGLITSNHDPAAPERHLPSADIALGPGCWIGMNSVILPGVKLGAGTVVAAGSVVTKSYEEGALILAGVPARVLRPINEKKTSGRA